MYATTVLGTGFAGPPAGAALFGVAAAAPFGADALSFGLAALLATRLRTDLGPVPGPRRSLAAEIGEGARWLWAHVELRTLVLMLIVWNVVEAGVFAVLVLWSLETLGLPEAGYGLLYAALAVGGVVGSVIAERVGRRLGLGRAMAVSAAATVLAFAGLGAVSSPAAAIALMALVGLAAFVWNVLTAAFRQSVVPVRIQGRVSSVYRFATWGSLAIGAVLGGAATGALGPRAPFLLAALGLGLASVVFLPRLSNERLATAWAASPPGVPAQRAEPGPVAGPGRAGAGPGRPGAGRPAEWADRHAAWADRRVEWAVRHAAWAVRHAAWADRRVEWADRRAEWLDRRAERLDRRAECAGRGGPGAGGAPTGRATGGRLGPGTT
jgi:hypothetical protein